MSFSFTALQRVENLAPGMDKVMLLDKAHHWPMLRRMIGKEWNIGPGIGELTEHPGLARRLRDSGRRIHVLPVNTDAQLALCESLGGETIISDRTAYMPER